jgi:hypothetical protein
MTRSANSFDENPFFGSQKFELFKNRKVAQNPDFDLELKLMYLLKSFG